MLAPWLESGIHHVGATSVPGLAAKPIIDMMAGVRDLEEARAAFVPLREHSYVHTPHRPRIAHHFSKPSPRLSEMTHSLHLTRPGSDLWRERLAFRDALRVDPALVAEYEALKRGLAKAHPGGRRRVHDRQAGVRRPRCWPARESRSGGRVTARCRSVSPAAASSSIRLPVSAPHSPADRL